MRNPTTKPERRQRKREWLQWRRLGRIATRLGHVTAIEPGPECTLGEFCRWYRDETPTIRVRARLTITPE